MIGYYCIYIIDKWVKVSNYCFKWIFQYTYKPSPTPFRTNFPPFNVWTVSTFKKIISSEFSWLSYFIYFIGLQISILHAISLLMYTYIYTVHILLLLSSLWTFHTSSTQNINLKPLPEIINQPDGVNFCEENYCLFLNQKFHPSPTSIPTVPTPVLATLHARAAAISNKEDCLQKLFHGRPELTKYSPVEGDHMGGRFLKDWSWVYVVGPYADSFDKLCEEKVYIRLSYA